MRTLSPKNAPFVKGLLGSMTMTATDLPFDVYESIKQSTNVLLPAPGGPVIPI